MLFKRIELIKSTSEHIYTAFYTIQWRSPHRMHIIDYADANLRQWAHCNIIYSINAINGVVWNALHHLPWDMIVDAGIAGEHHDVNAFIINNEDDVQGDPITIKWRCKYFDPMVGMVIGEWWKVFGLSNAPFTSPLRKCVHSFCKPVALLYADANRR